MPSPKTSSVGSSKYPGRCADEPNAKLSVNAVLRIAVAFLVFPTLFMTFVCRVHAERIVVAVQSIAARPYDEALKGFKSKVSHSDIQIQRIILAEPEGRGTLNRLNVIKPDLVLAIGLGALSEVIHMTDTPVVYVMVLTPPETLSREKHVTGVKMSIAPEKQLIIVRNALAQVKTIGLLYDPRRSSPMVERIQKVGSEMGISIVAKKVLKTEHVFNSLLKMRDHIDLFWMLPDLTVVTPETVEFFLLSAMESGTPLLTFSRKYSELGAVMAIASDPRDMGRQAAQMAFKILSGVKTNDIPAEDAENPIVTINLKTARKMGVALSDFALSEATVLD